MIFDERTYSVLVVSSSDKFKSLISPILPEASYSPVIYATSATLAKRALLERSYDLIIVNSPLTDELGTQFAIDVSANKNSVCMVIVKDEVFEETYSNVVRQGIFVLSKPLNQTILSRSIKWLEAAKERLRTIETKATSVEEKMEEIRIINRAKWLLIEKKGITEDEAHHYIEKAAMDNCTTKRKVAEAVIAKLKA